MRSYIFILVGIFLVGVLSGTPLVSTTAPGSSANVNFSLGGCSTSAGESIVRDGCSMDGDYFCSFNADTDIFLLEDTRVIGNACSFGGSVANLEGPGCCPSGMLCITQDNDEALCKDGNCDDYDGNPSGCADASCFYVGELCVSDFSDLPCSVYIDPGECEEDAYGLGQRGLGTEVCGTDFVNDTNYWSIPADSCECQWDGSICELYHNFTEKNFGASAETFSCLRDFTIGECLDGNQEINWTARSPDGGLDDVFLTAASCVDGRRDRRCGGEIIKLPFFSTFSLILSIILLGLFYFSRGKKIFHWKGL